MLLLLHRWCNRLASGAIALVRRISGVSHQLSTNVVGCVSKIVAMCRPVAIIAIIITHSKSANAELYPADLDSIISYLLTIKDDVHHSRSSLDSSEHYLNNISSESSSSRGYLSSIDSYISDLPNLKSLIEGFVGSGSGSYYNFQEAVRNLREINQKIPNIGSNKADMSIVTNIYDMLSRDGITVNGLDVLTNMFSSRAFEKVFFPSVSAASTLPNYTGSTYRYVDNYGSASSYILPNYGSGLYGFLGTWSDLYERLFPSIANSSWRSMYFLDEIYQNQKDIFDILQGNRASFIDGIDMNILDIYRLLDEGFDMSVVTNIKRKLDTFDLQTVTNIYTRLNQVAPIFTNKFFSSFFNPTVGNVQNEINLPYWTSPQLVPRFTKDTYNYGESSITMPSKQITLATLPYWFENLYEHLWPSLLWGLAHINDKLLPLQQTTNHLLRIRNDINTGSKNITNLLASIDATLRDMDTGTLIVTTDVGKIEIDTGDIESKLGEISGKISNSNSSLDMILDEATNLSEISDTQISFKHSVDTALSSISNVILETGSNITSSLDIVARSLTNDYTQAISNVVLHIDDGVVDITNSISRLSVSNVVDFALYDTLTNIYFALTPSNSSPTVYNVLSNHTVDVKTGFAAISNLLDSISTSLTNLDFSVSISNLTANITNDSFEVSFTNMLHQYREWCDLSSATGGRPLISQLSQWSTLILTRGNSRELTDVTTGNTFFPHYERMASGDFFVDTVNLMSAGVRVLGAINKTLLLSTNLLFSVSSNSVDDAGYKNGAQDERQRLSELLETISIDDTVNGLLESPLFSGLSPEGLDLSGLTRYDTLPDSITISIPVPFGSASATWDLTVSIENLSVFLDSVRFVSRLVHWSVLLLFSWFFVRYMFAGLRVLYLFIAKLCMN